MRGKLGSVEEVIGLQRKWVNSLCCPPHWAFTFPLCRCLAFTVWVLSDFSVLMAHALILLCSHIIECFLWISIHKGISAPMHLCSFTAFWLVSAVTEVPVWFSPFYHLIHHHILLMYFLRILAVAGSCCFPWWHAIHPRVLAVTVPLFSCMCEYLPIWSHYFGLSEFS